MNRLAFILFSTCLVQSAAAAPSTTGGSGGLALAALIAEHSPSLTHKEKIIMARLLDGRLNFSFPSNKKIMVTASAIDCRSSNVDISEHSCTLTFGAKKVELAGRRAHEIFATLNENGVPGDAGAGTNHEALTSLSCEIDPNGVKQKDGGGAACTYAAGP